MDFLNLDAGSEYANGVGISVLLRAGKTQEAREWVKKMPENPTWMRDFVGACLTNQPVADTNRMATKIESDMLSEKDSELKYHQASLLAYCGKKDIALRFLDKAVAENYCAYSGLQQDPLWENVRTDPGFKTVVEAASDCQKKLKAGEAR